MARFGVDMKAELGDLGTIFTKKLDDGTFGQRVLWPQRAAHGWDVVVKHLLAPSRTEFFEQTFIPLYTEQGSLGRRTE